MVTKSPSIGLEVEDAGADSAQSGRVPADLIAILVMAVGGLGDSIYLTTVHYAKVPLVCGTGGIVDCDAVTRSSYSVVPGTSIPVTIPGMLWFLVTAFLALLAWHTQAGRPSLLTRFGIADDDRLPLRLGIAQLVWCVAGLVAVFYLIYGEVRLHKICEWCTAVHILTAFTFFVVLYRVLSLIDAGEPEEEEVTQGT